jgi:hypothetical protein
MGAGHRTLAEARASVNYDDPAPFEWEERNVLHTFDDGWTIENVWTNNDRATEARLFDGRACITGKEWDGRLESGSHVLLSLRDPEGKPMATLLFGDAEWVISCRAGEHYAAYATARQFDQTPRCLDGKAVISLQCCPRGFMAGLYGEAENTNEIGKRVKAWYEALPIADEFKEYQCGKFMREDAKTFLKQRVDTKMADEAEGEPWGGDNW